MIIKAFLYLALLTALGWVYGATLGTQRFCLLLGACIFPSPLGPRVRLGWAGSPTTTSRSSGR